MLFSHTNTARKFPRANQTDGGSPRHAVAPQIN